MIRMQVQIPTELYKKAKFLSKEKEVSLADLIRKGLEIVVDGSSARMKGEVWTPPVLENNRLKLTSPDQLKDMLNQDRR